MAPDVSNDHVLAALDAFEHESEDVTKVLQEAQAARPEVRAASALLAIGMQLNAAARLGAALARADMD